MVNVLSLFDGISCGQLALERAGIKYDNYFASEIDKYAMKVTQHHYPKTIQLGDVTKLDTSSLPKIDILLAGFPCQAWSVAGRQKGLEDPRGKLALELLRVFKEVAPRYFLFENVRMKKENLDYMDELFGVKHIKINSSLVSAQNRLRCYWTNIPNITQPEDRGLTLKDILENSVDEKYYLSDKIMKGFNKPTKSAFSGRFQPQDKNEKSKCLTARYYKMGRTDPYIKETVPINYSSSQREAGNVEGRFYVAEKAQTLLAGGYSKKSSTAIYQINPSKDAGGKQPYIQDKIYHVDGKSIALTAGYANRLNISNGTLELVRRLTPLECERLQTVPDQHTKVDGISNTQRYKMLGNGWTIDVIAHILKGITQ